MKRLSTLLFSLMFLLSATAQQKVCIHFSDGTKLLKTVSEIDSITFNPVTTNYIKVETSEADNVRVDAADILLTIISDLGLNDVVEAGIVYANTESGLDDPDKQVLTTTDNVSGGNLNFKLTRLDIATTYYYKGYVKTAEDIIFSDVKHFATLASAFPVADIVELGLSVKWASWNMGASSVADRGRYIGWGDSTGMLMSADDKDYAVGNTADNISGTDYDVAHVQWGGKWRMPTMSELKELETLNWEYVENYDNSGISGWKLTSRKTGNSIFLPSNGYTTATGHDTDVNRSTFYWSSEVKESIKYRFANFNSEQDIIEQTTDKNVLMAVRPIFDENFGEDNTGKNDGYDPDAAPCAGRYVDLGLSVDWADMNVGAVKSSDCGAYYAWAETEEKTDYQPSTSFSYEKNIGSDISNTEYDVAHTEWKGAWRMPTRAQFQELVNMCQWTWTTQDNVNGYKVTGPNGNSIFLPANGIKVRTENGSLNKNGNYLTASSYTQRTDNVFNYVLSFSSGDYRVTYNSRAQGLAVRPVHIK